MNAFKNKGVRASLHCLKDYSIVFKALSHKVAISLDFIVMSL